MNSGITSRAGLSGRIRENQLTGGKTLNGRSDIVPDMDVAGSMGSSVGHEDGIDYARTKVMTVEGHHV